MRVIKLNRRYKAFKEGFTHALRFNSYDPKKIGKIENFLRVRYGSQYTWNRSGNVWNSTFGHAPRGSSTRPYWINLRNEADISMILLSGLCDMKS